MGGKKKNGVNEKDYRKKRKKEQKEEEKEENVDKRKMEITEEEEEEKQEEGGAKEPGGGEQMRRMTGKGVRERERKCQSQEGALAGGMCSRSQRPCPYSGLKGPPGVRWGNRSLSISICR